MQQQLVARIKRTGKYAYQAPEGGWFDVRVVPDMGYSLRGNNNNYRFSDVGFGVRLESGEVVDLKASGLLRCPDLFQDFTRDNGLRRFDLSSLSSRLYFRQDLLMQEAAMKESA